nr:MAG TPA: hypothetical protein [Caudoviricetes sp.]
MGFYKYEQITDNILKSIFYNMEVIKYKKKLILMYLVVLI